MAELRRALALLALLAACQPEASGPSDTCGARALAALVGQDVAALPDHPRLRIIRPGAPVTKDLRPDRLNADLDGADSIIRLWCG